MPTHIKNISFMLIVLFIILAGFYRSVEHETGQVNTLKAPLEPYVFEKNQCALHEQAWRERMERQWALLKNLNDQWEGSFMLQSLCMKDDLWELIVVCEEGVGTTELPSWLRHQADLISLRSCSPGKGCVYKCCLFI